MTEKQQHQQAFLKHLARTPKSLVVNTLRAANNDCWECIQDLCTAALSGKLPPVKLPKKSKRWFKGVVNKKHKGPDALRRSVLQRGGNKAKLISGAIKILAKVAVPAAKKAGKALLQSATTAAIDKGSEKLVNKIKKTKDIKEPTQSKVSLSDNPSAEEILNHKF